MRCHEKIYILAERTKKKKIPASAVTRFTKGVLPEGRNQAGVENMLRVLGMVIINK